MTFGDPNRKFSLEGLKERDQMVKNGYDPRTLFPGRDGLPVYDRDLSEELSLPRKPKEK